jgi:hypothetical protein
LTDAARMVERLSVAAEPTGKSWVLEKAWVD